MNNHYQAYRWLYRALAQGDAKVVILSLGCVHADQVENLLELSGERELVVTTENVRAALFLYLDGMTSAILDGMEDDIGSEKSTPAKWAWEFLERAHQANGGKTDDNLIGIHP